MRYFEVFAFSVIGNNVLSLLEKKRYFCGGYFWRFTSFAVILYSGFVNNRYFRCFTVIK